MNLERQSVQILVVLENILSGSRLLYFGTDGVYRLLYSHCYKEHQSLLIHSLFQAQTSCQKI